MTTDNGGESQPYRPGDVVNGYVLGADGRWLALAKEPRGPFGRYMVRWRRRWLKTVSVVTLAAFLSMMVFVVGGVGWSGRKADDVSWAWVVYNIVGSGLLYGTLVNFVVALPRRKVQAASPDDPAGLASQ